MTLQDQINELSKLIQKQNKEPEVIIEKKPVETTKIITYKERKKWLIGIGLIALLPFLYTIIFQSEWMPVFFGIAINGIFLNILLLLDLKLTNGDSFDKISESGTALAITVMAMVILFIGSLQFGERFSPERIKGEALQRIESQIGELQQRLNTEAPAKDSIPNWDEGATR